MSGRDLLDEALRLPIKERGRLVHDLIESLEDGSDEDHSDVARSWASELEARATRATQGQSVGRSLDSVCDDIEAKRRRDT